MNTQSLFDKYFSGDTYVDERDRPRLSRQLQDVFDVMKDGRWHTIEEVTHATGHPQQSVARQIRYLRADRFGGWTVSRRHVGNQLYEYRVEEFADEEVDDA